MDLANSLVKADKNRAGVKWFWSIVIDAAKKINPDCCFLAEWGDPVKAAECGFDLDYLSHATQPYNELFRSDKGTNLTAWLERAGNSYFAENGKGTFKNFLSYVTEIFKNPQAGYSIPTGFHDIIRIAEKKDVGLLKCIFAFILTFKCIPQIYYGDEIGIKHNYRLNKDGGYLRTGARTPMQWDNSTYRGFTRAKRAYLPTETAKTRCVESQIKDEKSLLNAVNKLIALHRAYPQFSYDADFEMLNDGYPLEFIRKTQGESIYVAINPTGAEYELSKETKEVLYSESVEAQEKTIKLKKYGFIVAKI